MKGILFEQLLSFYYRSLEFYQYCCPSRICIAGCVVSGDSGGLHLLGQAYAVSEETRSRTNPSPSRTASTIPAVKEEQLS